MMAPEVRRIGRMLRILDDAVRQLLEAEEAFRHPTELTVGPHRLLHPLDRQVQVLSQPHSLGHAKVGHVGLQIQTQLQQVGVTQRTGLDQRLPAC